MLRRLAAITIHGSAKSIKRISCHICSGVDLKTKPEELGTYAMLGAWRSRLSYITKVPQSPVSHLQQVVDKAVDLETPAEELGTYAVLCCRAPRVVHRSEGGVKEACQ